MTTYKATVKQVVFLGSSTYVTASGGNVFVVNPVVSGNAAFVTPEGAAFAPPSSQMISVSAVAGLSVRLAEAASGKVVWAGDFSYEGIDMPAALEAEDPLSRRDDDVTAFLGGGERTRRHQKE